MEDSLFVFSSDNMREEIWINGTLVHCISRNIFTIPEINKNGGVNDSVKTPNNKNRKPESNRKHEIPSLKMGKTSF